VVFHVGCRWRDFACHGCRIFQGTSQKYGLVKYDRLLSNKWCDGETIR
jgi:hypothetical protein